MSESAYPWQSRTGDLECRGVQIGPSGGFAVLASLGRSATLVGGAGGSLSSLGDFGHFQGEVAADCEEPLPRQQSLVLPRRYPRLCQHNNAERQFRIFASRWFGSRMQFASYGEALTLPVRQTTAYLVWMAMFPAGM